VLSDAAPGPAWASRSLEELSAALAALAGEEEQEEREVRARYAALREVHRRARAEGGGRVVGGGGTGGRPYSTLPQPLNATERFARTISRCRLP
jgi:hypothetical protein